MKLVNLLAGICVSAMIASGAGAQTAPPTDPSGATPAPVDDARGSPALNSGEIVVTASKRLQNIQDVPLAVTAVSESRLQSLNINSISNITAVAPSIVFIPAPNPNVVQFVVRGVGTFAFSDTLEQSVGAAIDGVPLGRIAGAVVDAVDVARVEVLRGPQGTVFGKSATAGLINVVNNKPQLDDVSFNGRAFIGENSEFRVQGTVNVPLIDGKVALRVSAWDFRRDGYLIAPKQSDGNVGDFHNQGIRARLAAQLTPDWRVDLSAEYFNNRNDGATQTRRGIYPSDLARGLPTDRTLLEKDILLGIVPGPRNITLGSDIPMSGQVKAQFYQVESNYDFGNTTLTWLSSYRATPSRQVTDVDLADSGLDAYSGYQRFRTKYRQTTSELRLATSGAAKLQYTLGLFYYDLDVIDSEINQAFIRNPGFPAIFNNAGGRRIRVDSNTKNYAGFFDGSYAIGDLKIIGGARLSYEKGTASFDRTLPTETNPFETFNQALFIPTSRAIAPFIPFAAKSDVHYTNFSYRAGLQYQLSENTMIFGTTSTGYKGPGLNFATDITPDIFNQTQARVKPETVRAFEGGIRSQLFDKTVTINLTGFYERFHNFQITAALVGVAGGLNYTIINAPRLSTRGAEAEFGWRPRGALEGVTIDGNAAFTEAHYDDFTNAPCYVLQPVAAAPTTQPGICSPLAGSTATLQSVDGLRVVGSPKWQLNLFGGYDRPIAGRVNGFFQAHYLYQSNMQLGVGNNPVSVVPGYHVVDLNIGIHDVNDRWRLSAIVKNVFDRFYITRIVTNNPGVVQAIPYEAFRSFGVALDVKF